MGRKKVERYCSTSQNPQRAVVPREEEKKGGRGAYSNIKYML